MNRREFAAAFDALPDVFRRQLGDLQDEVRRLEHVNSVQRNTIARLEAELDARPPLQAPEPAPEPVRRAAPSGDHGFPTVPLTTEQIRRLGLSDG